MRFLHVRFRIKPLDYKTITFIQLVEGLYFSLRVIVCDVLDHVGDFSVSHFVATLYETNRLMIG